MSSNSFNHRKNSSPAVQNKLEQIIDACSIPDEFKTTLLRSIRAEREALAAIALGGVPPHAPEIEEAILGAIISSGNEVRSTKGLQSSPVLHTVKSYIPHERYFYLENNQLIYKTILAMDANHLAVDQLTLTQYMRQNMTIDTIGGAVYLISLSDKVATTSHVETWARIVFEKYQERELIRTCSESIKNLFEHKGDVFAIAENLNKASRINSPNSLLRTSTMDADIVSGAMEKPKRRIIGDLIREREVSILFSDEKTGKTILALQFAIAAAQGNSLFGSPELFPNETEPMKVQIFDFEMENRELYDRYSDPNTGESFAFGDNVIRTIMNPECFDLRAAPERMIAAVEAEIEKHKPKFVIIDNITWLVKESTDADIAAEFMGKMLQLQRRYELSVLVIAHTPKRNTSEPLESRNLAGSKNLVNFCKNLIGVAASKKDKPIRYIKHIFSRNSPVIFDEQNVIECGIEKEPGSTLLKWNFIGFNKEVEHLTIPEQEYTEDQILEMVFNRRNKNMSYEQIRKDLSLPWHKTTIIRKLAVWESSRKHRNELDVIAN
jgi:RecA-family ATPase